jgi:hypothetical protein
MEELLLEIIILGFSKCIAATIAKIAITVSEGIRLSSLTIP